jgi:dTDP-4-amino-4,6-dideoxygalactose transaminase
MSADSLSEFLECNAVHEKPGVCMNKSTGRRIAACLPMHSFGHPVDLDRIAEICRRWDIPLIEDAAESLGSLYHQQHTGTFGLLGILSFNGNKIITTGGGGMILTRNEEIGRNAKYLTTQAKVPHPWEFYHDRTGYNYRLPNINAALGVAQMEQLPMFLEKKRILAQNYHDFFSELGIETIHEPPGSRSNYWLNAILLKDRAERDAFLEYTNGRGIKTRPAWTLMTKLPMFAKARRTELRNAEWIEDRLVNLPSSVIK